MAVQHEKRSPLKLGQAHLFHCHRFQIALSFVPRAVVGLAETAAPIARTGARAHAGYLAMAKAALSIQQARVCSAQVDSTADIAHLPAHGKPARVLKVTGKVGVYVCVRADVPTVGVLQLSRGPELPVSRVHLAAADARLCSAGAQPLLGRGGLVASRAQASAQYRLRGATPSGTAGSAAHGAPSLSACSASRAKFNKRFCEGLLTQVHHSPAL